MKMTSRRRREPSAQHPAPMEMGFWQVSNSRNANSYASWKTSCSSTSNSYEKLSSREYQFTG